jgi:SMODS-associated and fused to various effectors sensor domain
MSGHGGAVAARHSGEEYQARYFWTEALRMLGRRTEISSVAFEHPDSGKFDDVVVHYKPDHHRSALRVAREGAQLKFHVQGTGTVGWGSFTDPAFLGPKSRTTLVEAVVAAYRQHPEALFAVVTTWHLDGNDDLCSSLRGDDRRLELSRLFDAKRGELVQQRTAMLKLCGGDEQILRAALERVVLWPGISLTEITRVLDAQLLPLGLEPIGARLTSPYDSAPFASLRFGAVNWDGDFLRQMLVREFGWTPAMEVPTRRRVAVRQFFQFAENLDENVDAFLDLVDRFAHRRPVTGEDWNSTIRPAILTFVTAEIERHGEVELRLATSLSISYAIGSGIHEKAPAHIYVSQQTMGRLALWDTAAQPSADAEWQITTIDLEATTPDVGIVVSMTHDALDDVISWSRRARLPLSRIIGFRMASTGSASIRDASHCVALAQQIAVDVARFEPGGTLHLFLSGPAAFAVVLGRLMRGVSRVQLYEFDFERRQVEKNYFPSMLIQAGTD